jgi:hypothetical protein
VTRLQLSTQVDAALKIRNCLMHASGLLAHSRDAEELRRILKSGTFLLREHRKEKGLLRIVETGVGQRLQVANDYPWLLSSYLRDFFLDLCQLATASASGAIPSGGASAGLRDKRKRGPKSRPHARGRCANDASRCKTGPGTLEQNRPRILRTEAVGSWGSLVRRVLRSHHEGRRATSCLEAGGP